MRVIKTSDVAVTKNQTTCKVCSQPAELYGVLDFNKSCEETHGKYLPLAGVPIYYHRCGTCGLVFTEALDDWSKADYLRHIYNERYVEVDPDYVEARPREYAGITGEFLSRRPGVQHLDYGGGNGTLARILTEKGICSSSWDPMDSAAHLPVDQAFDVVTAFEVFEHTPTPQATVSDIFSLCTEACPVVLFSTFTIDRLGPGDANFWYIAPRNGHITIYTERSLKALWGRHGMQVNHFGNGWHLAFKDLPDWVDLGLFQKIQRRGRVRRRLRKLARMFTSRDLPAQA